MVASGRLLVWGWTVSLVACLTQPAAADYAAAQTAYQACKAPAEAGDAQCQNYLGVLYENGLGVAPDLAEAIRWFRLAAVQGNADAENNLGAAFQFGRGVPKDAAEAARWYGMSADRGNAAAANNLAVLYATGSG